MRIGVAEPNVDDHRRTYREPMPRALGSLGEPCRMPDGGIDAPFEEGCGNLLTLHQGEELGVAEQDIDSAERRSATADGSWMVWTASGIVGIWVAVALISLLAPDLVSGSEQQHMPVAAMTAWLWGLVATGMFLWAMGRLRGRASYRPIWIGLTVAILAVWLVATVLAITMPVYETGSDPTRLPIGAMVAPVAATVLTAVAGIAASVFIRPPEFG